jgi:16S rRNA (cytidine1402-2'-O)-methyltransferase
MPLVVVPTPIGNLEDITLRGLRELRAADVIACEDTRRTIKLLNHCEIKKPMVSYHRHNERARTAELIARIESGETVALVSDAGTPGVSDPGYILISEALARDLPVDELPGANAILHALLLSGLSPQPFTFVGFLDGSARARAENITALSRLASTLVFYVAPHDLIGELNFFAEKLGDRDAAIVREISKLHQEVVRGTLNELKAIASSRDIKGEIVVVTAGRAEDSSELLEHDETEDSIDWRSEASGMKTGGIFDKDIANALFESYGIPRNLVKAFLLGKL